MTSVATMMLVDLVGEAAGLETYMAQSTSIRRAAQLHHTVSILLVADDTHDLGTPEEVVDAIWSLSCSYDGQ